MTGQKKIVKPIDSHKRIEPKNSATLARLAKEVQQLESACRPPSNLNVVSSGCAAMDACLPASGYQPGSVVEYLRSTSGCGATYLALAAAAAALRSSEGKYLVLVDTHHQFYPPALSSHCISLSRVIWVRPESHCDAVWAADQALRTPAVAAVIADLEVLDERDARRLQLAAERGGGVGLLLRSLTARRMPSWAEVQWVIRSIAPTVPIKTAQAVSADLSSSVKALAPSATPRTGLAHEEVKPLRRLEVNLARVRGGKAGSQLLLDIDGVRGTIELAAREVTSHERIAAKRRYSAAAPQSALKPNSQSASA